MGLGKEEGRRESEGELGWGFEKCVYLKTGYQQQIDETGVDDEGWEIERELERRKDSRNEAGIRFLTLSLPQVLNDDAQQTSEVGTTQRMTIGRETVLGNWIESWSDKGRKRRRISLRGQGYFLRGWANWAEGKPSAKRDKLRSCHGCSRCKRRRRRETVRKSTRFFSFGFGKLSLSRSQEVVVWGGCVPTTSFHAFLISKLYTSVRDSVWFVFTRLNFWFVSEYIHNPDDLGGCWLTNSIQYLSGSY